jgi:hypothetical protein
MDLGALAALAGNSLVTAMVTDAWEDVRGKVARLFGRGQPDAKTVQRLNAAWQHLQATPQPDFDWAREVLAVQWRARFGDLIEDHPDAVTELVALVDEIRALPGIAEYGHSLAAGGDIKISADRGGFAVGVVHGNVAPPGPLTPDR